MMANKCQIIFLLRHIFLLFSLNKLKVLFILCPFQNEELYFGRSGYFYCTANFQSVLIHWKLLNQTSFNRNFNCAIKWKTQYRLLQVSFTYHSSYVPTYLGTSKVSICMYVMYLSMCVLCVHTTFTSATGFTQKIFFSFPGKTWN